MELIIFGCHHLSSQPSPKGSQLLKMEILFILFVSLETFPISLSMIHKTLSTVKCLVQSWLTMPVGMSSGSILAFWFVSSQQILFSLVCIWYNNILVQSYVQVFPFCIYPHFWQVVHNNITVTIHCLVVKMESMNFQSQFYRWYNTTINFVHCDTPYIWQSSKLTGEAFTDMKFKRKLERK